MFSCLRDQVPCRLFTQALDEVEFLPLSGSSSTDGWAIQLCQPVVSFVRGVDCSAAALDSPVKELLRQLPLPEPRGMRRLLGRLPHAILPREDYQRAAALLAEASAANVLHHAPSVTSALLMNLDQLPPRMRTPVVLRAIGDHADAGKYLLQWIDVVTARLPGTPPNTLPNLISRSRSLVQLQSGLRHFIDDLPALSESPPEKIIHATRLGTTNEIRRVGKRFQNCLSSFNGRRYGSRWLYHWQSGAEEAICEVVRAENMGWFLGDHLGFENKDLLPEVSARICAAFQQVVLCACCRPAKLRCAN